MRDDLEQGRHDTFPTATQAGGTNVGASTSLEVGTDSSTSECYRRLTVVYLYLAVRDTAEENRVGGQEVDVFVEKEYTEAGNTVY